MTYQKDLSHYNVCIFFSQDKDFREKIGKAFKDDQEDRILSSEEELDEVSEDDLRLTSSTDNDEEGNFS